MSRVKLERHAHVVCRFIIFSPLPFQVIPISQAQSQLDSGGVTLLLHPLPRRTPFPGQILI